mmetsp:Transcript_5922/g.15106  ORF Transcript_5922/g.15106 Transcript_5922/m.15106 type:complete len:753 (-) Transcript_5922:33-2291(-)
MPDQEEAATEGAPGSEDPKAADATPPPTATSEDPAVPESSPTDDISTTTSDEDDDSDAGAGDSAMDEDALVKATFLKEEGNDHFKKGAWDEAARCYRRGTNRLKKVSGPDADPQVTSLQLTLQTNHSMVLFKQSKYRASRDVASKVLDSDPKHVKALYRRALASRKMGDLDDAKKDLRVALSVDANNKACQKELVAVKKQIETATKQQKTALAKAFGSGGKASFLYNDKEEEERKKREEKAAAEKKKQEEKANRKKQWEDECVSRMAKGEDAISFDDWEKEREEKEKKARKEKQAKEKEKRRKEAEARKSAKAASKRNDDDDDDDADDDDDDDDDEGTTAVTGNADADANTDTDDSTPTSSLAQLWQRHRARTRRHARWLNRLLVKVHINKRLNEHNELQFNLSHYHKTPAHISEALRHGFYEYRGALRQQARNNSSLFLVPLRELQGMEGAQQWRTNGVKIQPKLEDIINDHQSNSDDIGSGGSDDDDDDPEKKRNRTASRLSELAPVAPFRIHPHYGVFRPNNRHKYLNLILQQEIPTNNNNNNHHNNNPITLMDVGTGSGVITALMLRSQRVDRAIATDSNPSAIRCAKDNLERLRLMDRTRLIQLEEGHIFPNHVENRHYRPRDCRADLIVCNPPWIPGQAASLMDQAVYDPNSTVLRSFLTQVQHHFTTEDSEAWLILSDLAERLGLRQWEEVEQMIHDGNLHIVGHSQTRVTLPAGKQEEEEEVDPIQQARGSEITHLYRLKRRQN